MRNLLHLLISIRVFAGVFVACEIRLEFGTIESFRFTCFFQKFTPCYFFTLFGALKFIDVVLACGLDALDKSPNMDKPKSFNIGIQRYPAKHLHIANFIEY